MSGNRGLTKGAVWGAAARESSVGALLRDMRLSAGVTQRELAERTGIRQANLSRLEHDAVSPTMATVARVADALGYGVRIEFVDRDELRMREVLSAGELPE